jgi:hypothetical protein
MFRSKASRLRSWWDAVTDDILGGDLPPSEGELEYHQHHPHRAPLRSELSRRHGSVAPRQAHCVPLTAPAPTDPRRTPRSGTTSLSR